MTPSAGDVYYLEIVTPEVDQVVRLYERVYGWRFQDMGPDMGHSHVAILPNGARCGVRAPMHEEEKTVTRSYVRVTDIEQRVKEAEEMGGFIALDLMEMPGGMGRIAIYFLGGIEHGMWEPPLEG